jgi:hypothetical protein
VSVKLMEIVLGVFGLQNTHHTHCGERERPQNSIELTDSRFIAKDVV